MAIAELEGRIDERVRAAREEMTRLQDARDALTAAVASPADTFALTAPRTEPRQAARPPTRSRADRL